MADTLTTVALMILAQEYRRDIVDQMNRRATTLKMLRITEGSGKNVSWVPEEDGAIAENYAEGADAANFGGDRQASAVLSWGLYRSNIHVSNLALDVAASTATPQGNRSRWRRELSKGARKLASTLNAALFTGAGTGTTLAGFDVAIGNAGNIYAGIDRSTQTYWRPTVVDPGTPTQITFAAIRDDLRKIFEACGQRPDVAPCAPAVFQAIGSLFDGNRQYQQEIYTAGRGKVSLDGSVGAIMFEGCAFYEEKDAPAGNIYYLNTTPDYGVEVEYLPPAMPEELRKTLIAMAQADDGYGPVPLGMVMEMLAKTGASEKAEIRTTMQLAARRPNSCGVRKNVATL